MKKSLLKERMVFSVRIELNEAYRHLPFLHRRNDLDIHYNYLKPDGKYCFDIESQRYWEYTDIVNNVKNIATSFQKKCNEKNTWMEVTEVNVLGIQQGSIELVLSVMMKLFDIAGGIKNVYDCADIIRKMLTCHFEEELADQFGRYFVAEAKVLAPTKKENGFCDIDCCAKVKNKRDAFFYYLLVSNIIMIVLLGLMVFKAVSKMYW